MVMKSIALLTMTFLPATFVSVRNWQYRTSYIVLKDTNDDYRHYSAPPFSLLAMQDGRCHLNFGYTGLS
jgi:hypothetical protein